MEELSASVMRQLSNVVAKIESDKREAEDGWRKEMAERKRLHNQVSSFTVLRQQASRRSVSRCQDPPSRTRAHDLMS
jgi:hypothetical protein